MVLCNHWGRGVQKYRYTGTPRHSFGVVRTVVQARAHSWNFRVTDEAKSAEIVWSGKSDSSVVFSLVSMFIPFENLFIYTTSGVDTLVWL